MAEFHIAQINVALLRVGLSDLVVRDVMAELNSLPDLAEGRDGLVWRLKNDDAGASIFLRPSLNHRLLVSMSVWTSIDALHDYLYHLDNVEIFQTRAKWFEACVTPLAIWWIPAGRIPTMSEGIERLSQLVQFGPTPRAFTFKQRFPYPIAPHAR